MQMNEDIFENNFSNFQVKSLLFNKTTLNELGNSSSIGISNYSSAAFYNYDYISQLSKTGE